MAVVDGQEVDSGVASEVGFAYALEKRILAYRNDFRLAGENQGTKVNLQLEYFIKKSKGIIVSDLSKLERELIEFYITLKNN